MVEADNADEARAKLITSIDRFLQQIALKFSVPLMYQGVLMEDETGNRYPIRTETMQVLGLRTYNLDELRDEVQQVQAYVGLNDDRLDRALTYFEHAVWLFEQQSQQGDFRSRHTGRRGLQYPARGPGAGPGLADRVQHRPAPQCLGLPDPDRLRQGLDTLEEVTAAAERGVQRIGRTHHLAFSFLRHCGLSRW